MIKLTGLYAAIGNTLNVTPEQRSAMVELTLARKLAFTLPLPSAPVEGLNGYFNDHCGSTARLKISGFNEEFPINVVAVSDMVYTFWKFRYYLVHPVGDEFSSVLQQLATAPGVNRLKEALSPVYIGVAGVEIAWDADVLIADFVAQ